jgi:hypothetical protein
VAGIDHPHFEAGEQLDEASADRIPARLIGRPLLETDLEGLEILTTAKKPPAPSPRRPAAARKARA